ncbi:major facilitator superfamily domain-containing protein 4A [Nematostella vectensis]|uniref:major facilitator superfamily domain-containing protein 4A n=1 Tax=Nematostella vectensis TaxID=45351 RepID=UPI0013902E7B|nr:major facilitator superfamily domain-containing protein 4A [Nematostella vectensis]
MDPFIESSSDDEQEPLFNNEDVEAETFQKKPFKQRVLEIVGDNPRNFKAAMCYCGVFMVFGMSDEVLGPTLLELRCLTGQTITIMSLLFFIHDLCNVFGSTTGGLFADRFNANLLLSIALGVSAVCIIAIPLCRVFVLMLILAGIYGACFGATDTFTTFQLIRMFGKQVSPYLQALHFTYGLGGFITPLVARPFLRDECVYIVNYTTIVDEWPYANSTSGIDNTSTVFFSQESVYRDSHVRWAYWIVALCHLPVIFGLLWLLFTRKLEKLKSTGATQDLSVYGSQTMSNPGYNHHIVALYLNGRSPWLRVFGEDQKPRVIVVTVLTSLILLLYDGLMATFGAYVYSYAVRGAVHMRTDHAAYLNSLFWGALSVGRFLAIGIALYLKPPTMMMIDLIGCLCCAFYMLVMEHSETALWLGTAGVGLFMSSVFPTCIALAEYYIDMTAPVTSVMIMSAALGELLLPLLVGQVFERLGPASFLVIAFCATFVALLIFILLRAIEGRDILGFFWFVWCGQAPSSACNTEHKAPQPNVGTGKAPVFDTVEMNVQASTVPG